MDIRLFKDDIWMPDIQMYNMKQSKALMERDLVVVSRDGSVVWVPPFEFSSSCKMDYTWFPFDEQRCDIKFGSWTYNGFKLNLQKVIKQCQSEHISVFSI